MGIKDGINALLAPLLSWKQARTVQQQAARIAGNEKQTQASYDRSRRAMFGELSSRPPEVIQACAAGDKAARRQAREDLVNRAVVSCPEHATEAARLRHGMDEVENMRCARHVYQDDGDNRLGDAPPGFRRATDEDLENLGLTREDLRVGQFKSEVYMKEAEVWGENPHPAAVLAFRGSTPAKEDWDNNFAQNANSESTYYRQAVSLGRKLHGSSVQLAGHSLGGGLASAAQGASGLPCSTYNSAGLHPSTVARYLNEKSGGQDVVPLGDMDEINAIRIKGEVLTATQEQGLLSGMAQKAVGTKRDLEPPLSADDFAARQNEGLIDKGDGYADYLHGMDGVIESMEQQKKADEAALQGCLAKGA